MNILGAKFGETKAPSFLVSENLFLSTRFFGVNNLLLNMVKAKYQVFGFETWCICTKFFWCEKLGETKAPSFLVLKLGAKLGAKLGEP